MRFYTSLDKGTLFKVHARLVISFFTASISSNILFDWEERYIMFLPLRISVKSIEIFGKIVSIDGPRHAP